MKEGGRVGTLVEVVLLPLVAGRLVLVAGAGGFAGKVFEGVHYEWVFRWR